MVKEIVIMPNTAEYPFSSAVRAGDFVFVSGNGGHVGKGGERVSGIVVDWSGWSDRNTDGTRKKSPEKEGHQKSNGASRSVLRSLGSLLQGYEPRQV